MSLQRVTADDLRPGQTYHVRNQGVCITPQIRTVLIDWIGPKDVHYHIDGFARIHNTPTERFLEIINQGRT